MTCNKYIVTWSDSEESSHINHCLCALQPPLFRIMHGKTRKYVLDDAEKEAYLSTLKESDRQKAEVTRMKGLGEMDTIFLIILLNLVVNILVLVMKEE